MTTVYPNIEPSESWVDYSIRLRKTCGIGLIDAGKMADKQVLLRDIDKATTMLDIRRILRRIVL